MILGKRLLTVAAVACLFLSEKSTLAAPPPGATTAPYTVTYTAKLTNASSAPITTPQSVRFSLWSDSDWDAGDIDGLGDINLAATGFTGWQETYTVTPNADGIFTVNLGSINTFPNFNSAVHAFLEVDVKPSTSANTAFEVLDPDGNTANTTDRKPFNSAPYAVNSDTVDNLDANNTPNNIPVLDGSGKLIFGVIPDSVQADTFTLDFDNNAPANVVTLQFGQALGEYFRFNDPVSRFEISDDLNIEGNLTFTGTAQITGATIDGTLNTIQNIPNSALAPYLKKIRISPEYNDSTLSSDGSDNIGTMKLEHENNGANQKYNFYQWTTNLAAAQDLDIVIRYQLPTDFVSFDANPITLTYQTADTVISNNSVNLTLNDSNDVPVNVVGGTNLTSPGIWTDAAITFAGSPTFTPGTFIEFTIKANTINSGKYVKLGDLVLNYNGR